MISVIKRTKKEAKPIFVVLCLDRLGTAHIRSQFLEAHRRYVDEQASIILSSGPLLDEDGTTRSGQMFILYVHNRQQAEAFIEADPFTAAALFETVIIRRFAPIFNNGARQRFL